jgi:hypothetical protein
MKKLALALVAVLSLPSIRRLHNCTPATGGVEGLIAGQL